MRNVALILILAITVQAFAQTVENFAMRVTLTANSPIQVEFLVNADYDFNTTSIYRINADETETFLAGIAAPFSLTGGQSYTWNTGVTPVVGATYRVYPGTNPPGGPWLTWTYDGGDQQEETPNYTAILQAILDKLGEIEVVETEQKTLLQSIVTILTSIKDNSLTAILTAIQGLNDTFALQTQELITNIQEIKVLMQTVSTDIKAYGDLLALRLTEIKTDMQDAVVNILEPLRQLRDDVRLFVTTYLDQLRQEVITQTGTITQAVNGVASSVTGGITSVSTVISNTSANVVNAVNDGTGNLLGAINNAASNVSNSIQTVGGFLGQKTDEIKSRIDEAKDSINTGIENVKGFWQTLYDDFKNWLLSIYDWFKQAFNNILDKSTDMVSAFGAIMDFLFGRDISYEGTMQDQTSLAGVLWVLFKSILIPPSDVYLKQLIDCKDDFINWGPMVDIQNLQQLFNNINTVTAGRNVQTNYRSDYTLIRINFMGQTYNIITPEMLALWAPVRNGLGIMVWIFFAVSIVLHLRTRLAL